MVADRERHAEFAPPQPAPVPGALAGQVIEPL